MPSFLQNATSLEEFRVDGYLGQAASSPEQAMTQLLDTIDGAVERQEGQVENLSGAYENLSGSVFGSLKTGIKAIKAPNLTKLRAKLVEIAGNSVAGLLPLLFDKALDTAFTYGSRALDSMANRILKSLQVYAEMFFRGDQLIVDACASYLAKQIVVDLRDISNEMGGFEQVLVRLNAIAKEVDAITKALTDLPAGGPAAFLRALKYVRRARTDISNALLTLETTGVIYPGYISGARLNVKSAQDTLPQAPLTEFDLERLKIVLEKLAALQDLIDSFLPRLQVIAAKYARVLAYAAIIRSLPANILGESGLLRSLVAETGLKTVDLQLAKVEGRLKRHSSSNLSSRDVYHQAIKERIALEGPHLELLMMERLLFRSPSSSGSYEDLLKVLDSPFLKGDPFAEFRRMVSRYTGMASKSPVVSSRMVSYSSTIIFAYRGIRSTVLELAQNIEWAAPKGDAVTKVTDSITEVLSWAGVRNPMMVASSGVVVATLLTKQVGNLQATARLSKNAAQNSNVIDLSNGITEFVAARTESLTSLPRSAATDAALEPLASFRPFFRKSTDSLSRSRLTSESILTVRREALLSTSISQVILDTSPQFDAGIARGLKQLSATNK